MYNFLKQEFYEYLLRVYFPLLPGYLSNLYSDSYLNIYIYENILHKEYKQIIFFYEIHNF